MLDGRKEIKVLCVIESLGLGGAERLLVSLLPHISKSNVHVDVVSLFIDTSLSQELEERGIKVLPFNIAHRWNIFSAVYKLFTVLKAGNYDVVWSHLYFGNLYSALVGYMFPSLSVIWTLHSPRNAMSHSEEGIIFRLRGFFERLLGEYRANKIVAVSKSVALDYKSSTKWKNVDVIYNGIELSDFPGAITLKERALIRKKYDILPDDLLIVTPGRYSPEKGHSIMVIAFALLVNRSDNKSIRWVAAGYGNSKKALEKLISSHGVEDKITLLDSLPHSSMLSLIQSADLVVLPSIRESFGISAVESMYLGTPVVVSNVDGLAEVVADSVGVKVKPNDSEELSEAILTLLQNEEKRINLAKLAKKYACENFDIQISADKWTKTIIQSKNV